MAFFEDLTAYTYTSGSAPPGTVVLAVGWLDEAHPYPTGQPPEHFLERLGMLCADHPVMRMRGYHECRMCPSDTACPITVFIDGVTVTLGSAEIRVVTPTGDVLAAPTLIYHYVQQHSYLPPALFNEAVLASRVAQ